MLTNRKVVVKATADPFSISIPDSFTESSWPPQPLGAGIVVTNYCPAACAHCYNSSSPKGKHFLSVGSVNLFLSRLCDEFPDLSAVGISGGEPFAHPQLLDIVKDIKRRGLLVSCTTSGIGLDRVVLKQALHAGLDEIVVSADGFHERFQEQSNVVSFANFAADNGAAVKLNVCIRNLEEVDEAVARLDPILRGSIQIECHPLTSVGRATKLSGEIVGEDSCCSREFQTIALNYDGAIYPCCSVGGFTEGLRLGNLSDLESGRSIGYLYQRSENVKLLARNKVGKVFPSHSTALKCETCHKHMSASKKSDVQVLQIH